MSSDAAVQHTNDESVLSKCSVAKCGYLTDDTYLQNFVQKLPRRSPLINRGYYLRIVAMTELACHALQCFHHTFGVKAQRQVLSLGAGFDTFAARHYKTEGMEDVHYFEVDFPPVISNKAALMKHAGLVSAFPFGENTRIEDGNVHAERYHAIGCDLRESEKKLEALLTQHGFDVNAPTVVYAECVMQYMPPEGSTEVVSWVANHLPNAVFMAYDQINPGDSWGQVMTGALGAKASPLLGTAKYPGEVALAERAYSNGLNRVSFANFFNVSAHHLQGAERDRIESIEPFDEHEEWAEMCDHYGILAACTPRLPDDCFTTHPSLTPVDRGVAEVPRVVQHSGALQELENAPTFSGWGHATSCDTVQNGQDSAPETTLIITIGGLLATGAQHKRINTIGCYSTKHGAVTVHVAEGSAAIPAMMGASLTKLSHGTFVIFGGRTSPINPSSRAFLVQMDYSNAPHSVSTTVKELQIEGHAAPTPRHRHLAHALSQETLFVYGGLTGPGTLPTEDGWVATVDTSNSTIRWRQIQFTGAQLPPLASAGVANHPVDSSTLVVCGGMTGLDKATGQWFSVTPSTGCVETLPVSMEPRFSHTLTQMGSKLVVLGGTGVRPKRLWYENEGCLQATFSANAATPLETSSISLPDNAPTLSKHGAVHVGGEMIVVVGGGFFCFSFGAFTNPSLVVHLDGHLNKLDVSAPPAEVPCAMEKKKCPTKPKAKKKKGTKLTVFLPPREDVPLTTMSDATTPVLVANVITQDLVRAWQDTPDAAAASIDNSSCTVAVSNSRKQDLRNPKCNTVSIGELVAHTFKTTKDARSGEEQVWHHANYGARMEVSQLPFQDSHLPRRLWHLQAGKADTVYLPVQVETSVAFVQAIGEQRLVLFPPSEAGNLYVGADRASSMFSPIVNVDSPELQKYPRFIDAHRSALEVQLKAGDAVVVPPCWFVHRTITHHSVSFVGIVPTAEPHIEDVAALRDEIVASVTALVAEKKGMMKEDVVAEAVSRAMNMLGKQ